MGSEQQLAEEKKQKIEQLIEEEEGISRKVKGFWDKASSRLSPWPCPFSPSTTTVVPVTTQILRSVFVAFLLALSFLYYPISRKYKGKISLIDIFLSLAALAPICTCSATSRSSSTGR